ncbi:MAG: ribosomal RNA small subunit methyltransferase A [Actinobacteria bacterium]|nr:ribosomal RNA small subunit methyltransferase A [Actinomycetota bacterium]
MQQAGIRAKQSLGQNFLVDQNIAKNIVRAFGPSKDDRVIEIGPGFGILTVHLQPQVKKLIAVEIDKRLYENIQNQFAHADNFDLVQGDFLKQDIFAFEPGFRIRLIGNIPYNITSPIFFKAIEAYEKIIDLTLLIQKEVAQRVVAPHGCKDYGILSVFSQLYADVKILLTVPGTVFRPRPKVESALVRWTFTRERIKQVRDVNLLRKIVKQAFGQRRKMLRNSLKDYLSTERKVTIKETQRPEQLTVADWIKLTNELST